MLVEGLGVTLNSNYGRYMCYQIILLVSLSCLVFLAGKPAKEGGSLFDVNLLNFLLKKIHVGKC